MTDHPVPGSPAGKPASAQPVPGWEIYRLACLACRHHFTGWLPTNVPVPVFVATLNNLSCPKCRIGPNHITLDLETATTEEP